MKTQSERCAAMGKKFEIRSMNEVQRQELARLRAVGFAMGYLDGQREEQRKAKKTIRALERDIARIDRERAHIVKSNAAVLRDVERELKQVKRDSLEMLNEQRETIVDLQARAVSEGWVIERVSRRVGEAWICVEMLSTLSTVRERWQWKTMAQHRRDEHVSLNRTCSDGLAMTLNDAIKQAEKAGKKVRR